MDAGGPGIAAARARSLMTEESVRKQEQQPLSSQLIGKLLSAREAALWLQVNPVLPNFGLDGHSGLVNVLCGPMPALIVAESPG